MLFAIHAPRPPWQVGVGAAAEPAPTPAEQQEDAECDAEEELCARAKQQGTSAARKKRYEEKQRVSAPGSDVLRVSAPAAAPACSAALSSFSCRIRSLIWFQSAVV